MNKDRKNILLSIINLNWYSLKKSVYGSAYEQITLYDLNDLPMQIETLVNNHKHQLLDWSEEHKTNLKRIKEACKELTN